MVMVCFVWLVFYPLWQCVCGVYVYMRYNVCYVYVIYGSMLCVYMMGVLCYVYAVCGMFNVHMCE